MRPAVAALAALALFAPCAGATSAVTPPSGAFRLNLRLYGPAASVLDGTWKPPSVERVG